MVDFDLEIQKMRPINIKEIELNRYRIDERAKKSIILYNSAIGSAKKGNIDLAINDLKKALFYNKNFTEAIILISLCYASVEEYGKSEKTLKKLNKYEVYNELTNEYIQALAIRKTIHKGIKVTEFENIHSEEKKRHGSLKKSTHSLVISLVIIVSIVTGAGIKYFYTEDIQGVLIKIKTSILGTKDKFENKKNIDESKVEIDKSSEKDEILSVENTIPNSEDEKSQKNLEEIKSKEDNSKDNTANMLNDAKKFLSNGDYEKAASILISMKSMNLDTTEKIKFTELWEGLKLNPLWTIYNDGNKLYKQKKYAEALPKLIIASEIDPDLDIMPWITFQIGMCYKANNDNTNALAYFNKVKDNYPKSEYSSNARMMIKELSN